MVGYISLFGCGERGTQKNPMVSAGDSTGTAQVAEDSIVVPPVEEIPTAPVLRLAFLSGQSADHDIFLWKTDGSVPINLTQNPGRYYGLAWSPDGGKLAFTQDSGVSGGSIEVMDIEEQRKVTLTAQPGDYGGISWSSDGTRLVFSYQRRIYVVDVDGTNMNALTEGGEFEYDSNPVWSPDGSQIAFTRATFLESGSFDNAIIDLYTVPSDGGRPFRLNEVSFNGYVSSLSWSPDGNEIVFAEDTNPGAVVTTDISVLNVNSGISTNLTNSPTVAETDPVWSPDGGSVAFAAYGKGVFVAKVNGGGMVSVTRGLDLFPKWSLGGQEIVFVHQGSDLDIYSVDIDDGTRTNLTEGNPVSTREVLFFTGYFAWAPQ
jgi:Tol biopolymer transport system component